MFAGGNVDFSNAVFAGSKVNFLGAKFTGGTVGFDSAEFTGGLVWFDRAETGHTAAVPLTGKPPAGVILPTARMSHRSRRYGECGDVAALTPARPVRLAARSFASRPGLDHAT